MRPYPTPASCLPSPTPPHPPTRSVLQAAKVDRILEFLQEPKPLSDVDLASKVCAAGAC